MTDHVANSRCRANHEWQQERAITGRVGADKARRAEQDPRKAARADMTSPVARLCSSRRLRWSGTTAGSSARRPSSGSRRRAIWAWWS